MSYMRVFNSETAAEQYLKKLFKKFENVAIVVRPARLLALKMQVELIIQGSSLL
jgi:hypothetical protein